jgi:sulfate permease, SulP family
VLAGLDRLIHYQRNWLRGDLLAGVTVAAYLIPQVMAYAVVAGLPPITGLWTIMATLLVYAVLGSSPLLSVGPESTTALMTAAVVGPLAVGSAGRYAALAAALALVVGVLCILAGAARLGFLADLLSKPVLVGYMAGIAVIMISGQLGKVTGVNVTGESFLDQIRSFGQGIGGVQAGTVLLAALVLAFLLVASRLYPRAPMPLVAILLATAAVVTFSLADHGIRVVGGIPAGFPTPAVPNVGLADLGALVLPAVGVAVVGFSDNVITARAFAARAGHSIDANVELYAIGAANVAAGFVHGFPVSSSASRTAIGHAVGSRTQVYSLVAMASVALTLLLFRPALARFPTAALGAIVIFAAIKLVDIPEFVRLARFRRSELILAVLTTVAVLTVGILDGILVAVGLSIMDLLRRVARPHDGILGYVPGVAGMHDIDDYPNAALVPGLVVYRYDSPLFFANAEDFKRRALASLDVADGPVEWFVLNTEAMVEVDITGIDALDELREELERRGIVLAAARVKQDLRDDLAAAGLIDRIGEDRIFMTLPTAVDAYLSAYAARHGGPPPGYRPPGR